MQNLFDGDDKKTVSISGVGGMRHSWLSCTNISWDESTGILRFADSNGNIVKAGGKISWLAETENE